jgi:PleD family two-component response regulator
LFSDNRQVCPYPFYSLQVFSEFKISVEDQDKENTSVDDEPDVAVTIESVLEESGLFQVDRLYDAASALSIFRPGVYDLALLDIKMPRMNGFELSRKLKGIDLVRRSLRFRPTWSVRNVQN